MKEPKHTPGPWKLNEIGDYTIAFEIEPGQFRLIARYEVSSKTEIEDLSNARLIAAAPEMLDFVRMVLREQLEHGEHGDQTYISAAEELLNRIEGGGE